MQKVVKDLTRSFALPVAMIGHKGFESKKPLMKTRMSLTPISKNHFIFKAHSEQNVLHGFSENDIITMSLLGGRDLNLLKNDNTVHEIIYDEQFKVPHHKRLSNVLFFEIGERFEIAGERFSILKLIKATLDSSTKTSLNFEGLLEDESAYYKVDFLEEKPSEIRIKNEPYHFNFKYKICRMKEKGATYKYLSKEFGVYHETIKDWYTLYQLFGREGLTRSKAKELAASKFARDKKRTIARDIIEGRRSYRDIVREETVSLSRVRNWVKKERRGTL